MEGRRSSTAVGAQFRICHVSSGRTAHATVGGVAYFPLGTLGSTVPGRQIHSNVGLGRSRSLPILASCSHCSRVGYESMTSRITSPVMAIEAHSTHAHEDPAAARQVLRKLLGGGAITVTPDADGWAYSGDLGLDGVVLSGCTNPPSQWAGRG